MASVKCVSDVAIAGPTGLCCYFCLFCFSYLTIEHTFAVIDLKQMGKRSSDLICVLLPLTVVIEVQSLISISLRWPSVFLSFSTMAGDYMGALVSFACYI